MTNKVEGETGLSRRSLIAALLGAVVVAPAVAITTSDAEAQERQFTGFRHESRVQRPRSPLRGSRRHRRVARVRHTGSPQPRHDIPEKQ